MSKPSGRDDGVRWPLLIDCFINAENGIANDERQANTIHAHYTAMNANTMNVQIGIDKRTFN